MKLILVPKGTKNITGVDVTLVKRAEIVTAENEEVYPAGQVVICDDATAERLVKEGTAEYISWDGKHYLAKKN